MTDQENQNFHALKVEKEILAGKLAIERKHQRDLQARLDRAEAARDSLRDKLADAVLSKKNAQSLVFDLRTALMFCRARATATELLLQKAEKAGTEMRRVLQKEYDCRRNDKWNEEPTTDEIEKALGIEYCYHCSGRGELINGESCPQCRGFGETGP